MYNQYLLVICTNQLNCNGSLSMLATDSFEQKLSKKINILSNERANFLSFSGNEVSCLTTRSLNKAAMLVDIGYNLEIDIVQIK